jgi:hypothetical protein
MTDHELETQLRERLHATDLPAAPATLRRALAEMPEPAARRQGRRMGGIVLLAAATMAIVGVGAIGTLGSAPPREADATVAPTASVVDVPPSSAVVPDGFVPFDAPGIAFAHPGDWVPSSAYDDYPDMLGVRFVGAFARGMTLCPLKIGADPEPTDPPGCERKASRPGTVFVYVIELIRQLPGTLAQSGMPTTYAGYPGSAPQTDVGDADPIGLTWAVAGPDDGLYLFRAEAPNAEIEEVRHEMEATLGTLRLSSWLPAPEVVEGNIHVETGRGFSFDYPERWSIYYPLDMASGSSPVVTISSQPLAPCADDGCQGITVPPGTAMIAFRIGSRPGEPDWTKAHTTVDGQPAFVQHWDQAGAGADEGDQLNVRLDDSGHTLSISSAHREPGIDEQRELVGRIIDSIQVDAPPP